MVSAVSVFALLPRRGVSVSFAALLLVWMALVVLDLVARCTSSPRTPLAVVIYFPATPGKGRRRKQKEELSLGVTPSPWFLHVSTRRGCFFDIRAPSGVFVW